MTHQSKLSGLPKISKITQAFNVSLGSHSSSVNYGPKEAVLSRKVGWDGEERPAFEQGKHPLGEVGYLCFIRPIWLPVKLVQLWGSPVTHIQSCMETAYSLLLLNSLRCW